MRDDPKYTTLEALAEALHSGEEPAAFCSYDKEVVTITTERRRYDEEWGDYVEGAVLFECDEDEFIFLALKALGVQAEGV